MESYVCSESAHGNILIAYLSECGAKCKLGQISKNSHKRSNKTFAAKWSNFHNLAEKRQAPNSIFCLSKLSSSGV